MWKGMRLCVGWAYGASSRSDGCEGGSGQLFDFVHMPACHAARTYVDVTCIQSAVPERGLGRTLPTLCFPSHDELPCRTRAECTS